MYIRIEFGCPDLVVIRAALDVLFDHLHDLDCKTSYDSQAVALRFDTLQSTNRIGKW